MNKTKLFLAVFTLFTFISNPVLRAADISWTNLAGGNWNVAANWNPNQIPATGDSVWITNAGNYAVTSSVSSTLSALNIGAGTNGGLQTLQITAGTLTVTNTIGATNSIINILNGTMLSVGSFANAGAVNQNGASANWRLLTPGTLNTHNYTNGEFRGATLTVTNFNWAGGNLYADVAGDKTIIAPGGTFNLIGDGARTLSYYAGGQGRYIDNYGTWNWSGNSILYSYPGVVNNYGSVNITGQGVPSSYAQFSYVNGSALPTFNNFGTFTKTVGTNIFYFGSCNLNNSGTIDLQSGTLIFYVATVSNTGPVNIKGTLQSYSSTVSNYAAITLTTNSVFSIDNAGAFTFAPSSSLVSPDTNSFRVNAGTVYLQSTNVISPSVWIAGGTLYQQTNNVIPAVNQTAGVWKLAGIQTIDTYNLTNGELRGGTLIVTNLNWINGNMNADATGDKTIIPVGGVLNFSGNATRNLSYYVPATRGRDIDNHGTWNWSGDSLLYGVNPAVVNNYGNVNVTGTGTAQFVYNPGYSSPVWNNYGTFYKSVGTGVFYFNTVNLNNSGALNVGSGTLSVYGSTFTNLAAMSLSVTGFFVNENGSATTWAPGSSISSPSGDHISVVGGSIYLQTTNIFSPSLQITGGALHQMTNNVVPTINQTAGIWRHYVTNAVNTYNFNGGELRGGTLTVTNLNWTNGNMNADANGDKTIIPIGGILNFPGDITRNLSYNAPATRGRDLENNGTWNWSGNSLLYGVGAAVVNNHGAVNLTSTGNPQFLYYPGYAAPFWNNFGTFTKSVGTNYFYFQGIYLNNSGSFSIQTGHLSLYGSGTINSGPIDIANGIFQIYSGVATNSSSITLSPASILQTDNGAALYLLPSTTLVAPTANSIRLNSGTTYNGCTNISSPSIWIAGGNLVQQRRYLVATINQSAGELNLTVPVELENYNLTNGLLRGRILTVTNFNWIAGNLYADGIGDKTIIPAGGVLNMSGNSTRALTYNAPATAGRGLDNYGTWNWTGDSLLQGVNPAVVNNYGAVIATGTANSQFTYVVGYSSPVWNNYGTFTKSSGTNYFYFTACYLNNLNLIEAQTGKLSFHASVVTNSTGLIQIAANALLFSENNNLLHLLGGSRLVSPGYNNVRLDSGTVYVGTTNIVSPSLWLGGATVVQQTNIVVADINQSAGTFQLLVPNMLANYNLTNGVLRGRDLIVTNFNWIAGNLYADANGDKTIIPTNGVLNMTGATARYFTYNSPATVGRGLDNYGTWNWTGDCILYALQTGSVVNNYGAVNVTATGNPQFSYNTGYSGPVWNNFGTFTKSNGTNYFYFTACYLNNTNLLDVQSGKLSFYAAVTTNNTSGKILLGENAMLFSENNNTATLEAGSILAGASPNSFRITSGTVYLRSTAISIPSISLAGGTLRQEANNVVPEINQSGGTWQLALPVGIENYNLSNGELRGADLTINNFNWLGGNLHSDGPGSNVVTVSSALNISGNTAKSMSYYVQPGRSLINNGVGIWGGVGITGQGAATIRNNGSLTLTNDVALAWGGTGPVPVFHNTGTFTKIAGNGTSPFGSTTITNSGTFNVNSGGIQIGGAFVQAAGSAHLGTNFIASSALRVEAGTLTGRGNVAGAFYNNGTVNPGASPGLITGTSYTNSATGILNIELAGLVAGTSHDQIQLSGAATLDGTMNVTLANNFAPQLSNSFTVMQFASRVGTFPTITPPPGVTFDAVYSNTNLILTVIGLTNAPLEITSYPSNQTIWTPDPVSFGVGISGVTPITYQWQHNGTNLANATNSVFNIAAVATTNAGVYNVLVTDANGGTTNASATLTVIPFVGTMNWTNTAGGNWSVPTNWEPNRVPGATNTAIISISGTYTVNVNSSSAVSNLFVGQIGVAGNPTLHIVSANTLALNGDAIVETNGIIALNGLLQTAGSEIDMRGRIDWYTGTLSGAGNTIIASNALVYFTGSQATKNIVTNIVENYGTWTTSPDAGIGPGQLPRFSGGAQLTNHISGVINMGANGLIYAGSQTPRSYLVNFGRIVTSTTSVFSPSQIGIDFINYGILDNNSYVYIGRGTNFGTMQCINGLAEISIFGDPTSGEYFSFEPGTTFNSPQVNIAAAGPVQWRAGNVTHPGRLFIAQASGGATYANAEFKILANYTNTAQVTILRGALTIPGTNTVTDLRSFSDGFQSFWSFGITNAGTMYVDNLSRSLYGFGNSGSVIVRSNATFSGGSLHGNGQLFIRTGASTTLSGGNFDTHYIENLGNITVSGAPSMTGNSILHNKPTSQMYFNGGGIGGGPASVINESSISGFGGIGVSTTNYASVLIDDTLERTMTLSSYVQKSGTTQILRGRAGGNFDIQGGILSGTNSLTGTLRNSATFNPGTPIGLLSITGNYTNAAIGLQSMAIQETGAVSNHTQVQVGGTAYLGGTLTVSFNNGFLPSPGNLFTAMVFTARSGMFDAIINPSYQLEAFYTSTTLVLRAENLLPIASLNVSGGNTQIVCRPFKVSASASDPDGTVTNISLFMNGVLIASNAGSSVTTTVEKDFPSVNAFTVQATDNRSGVGSTMQNVDLTTLPLHVLTLGGFRTNDFKICMLGELGSNYMTLANTNLNTTNWVEIGPMIFTNGIWRYFDTNGNNYGQKYYKAQQQ